MVWYEKWAVMEFGLPIAFGGYNWISWSALKATDWAAWVQAIGSIVAIGTGFAVASYQTKAAAKLARRTQAEASFNQINTVVEILKFASSVITKALKQMNDKEFPSSYHQGESDPINFQGVEIALLGIPIFELKSAEMIENFFQVQDCYSRLKSMVEGSADGANLDRMDFADWTAHLTLIERQHTEAIYQINQIFEFAQRELAEF